MLLIVTCRKLGHAGNVPAKATFCHGVMSLPSLIDDGTIKVTWPWRNVVAKSTLVVALPMTMLT
jgi:preprotein translocase subunit SecE